MALQTKIKDGWKYAEVDSTIYFELYMQCPVCIQNNIPNVSFTYWQHKDCGGRLFIGDNGKYICENCCVAELIALWAYHCPRHEKRGLGTYVNVTDKAVIADTIGVAAQIVRVAGIPWLKKVLTELEKQDHLFLKNVSPQKK